MASFEHLCDVDAESDSKVDDHDVEGESGSKVGGHAVRPIVVAFLMLAIVAFGVAWMAQSSRTSSGQPPREATEGLRSLMGAGAGGVSFGLHKAACPYGASDKSDGAQVTLDRIKEFVGANKSEEVKFWYVYPDAAAQGKNHDNDEPIDPQSAEMEFMTFGGFMYQWGDQSVCFAVVAEGNDLTLIPTDSFPKADIEWHQPVHDPLFEEAIAWIPPAGDPVCEHGCFVYKESRGQRAFSVM